MTTHRPWPPTHSTKKTLAPAMLFTSALLASSSGHGQGRESAQTLPVDPEGTIEIQNVLGSVRVRSGPIDEVGLVARLGRGTEGLTFRPTEGGVLIRVELPENGSQFAEGSELMVDVPGSAALDIKTVSAGVDVRGVDGAVSIKTVSGKVEAQTGDAPVRLKTVSGDIALQAQRAALDLVSVSGTLTVGVESLRGLNVRSISGDLWLSAGNLEAGEYSVKSQSADTLLRIPEAVPVGIYVKGLKGARQELGDLGEAAPRIEVKTLGGKVKLERS